MTTPIFPQGLADWDKIRAVKEAVAVPVFANGNVLFHSDIETCLKATGADAVMSAETQLYNPAIFAPASPSLSPFRAGVHPPHTDLALEYLSIVRELQTKPSPSAIKGHLFKLMRPGLVRETDLRERLGRIKGDCTIDVYFEIVKEMQVRMEVRGTEHASSFVPLTSLEFFFTARRQQRRNSSADSARGR
jgi:tRNA-dihydrouridine synthase 1